MAQVNAGSWHRRHPAPPSEGETPSGLPPRRRRYNSAFSVVALIRRWRVGREAAGLVDGGGLFGGLGSAEETTPRSADSQRKNSDDEKEESPGSQIRFLHGQLVVLAVSVLRLVLLPLIFVCATAVAESLRPGESPEPLVAVHAPEGTQEDQREHALKNVSAVGPSDIARSTSGAFHFGKDLLGTLS